MQFALPILELTIVFIDILFLHITIFATIGYTLLQCGAKKTVSSSARNNNPTEGTAVPQTDTDATAPNPPTDKKQKSKSVEKEKTAESEKKKSNKEKKNSEKKEKENKEKKNEEKKEKQEVHCEEKEKTPKREKSSSKRDKNSEKEVEQVHEVIKPKMIARNAKEERIAKGKETRGKGDYPTMDDVLSDWDSDKEGKKPTASEDKGDVDDQKSKAGVTNLEDVDEGRQCGEDQPDGNVEEKQKDDETPKNAEGPGCGKVDNTQKSRSMSSVKKSISKRSGQENEDNK